jgi:hypothetical protein
MYDRKSRPAIYRCVVFWGLALIVSTFPVLAQELNCAVQVNYQTLTGTDNDHLNDLQLQVREYLNERRWTEDRFDEEEEIECSFQITFLEALTLTTYRARLIVSARRPIYGTGNTTTVINLNDESWTFDYARGTPLVYNPDAFHPLTSVLNFYAYMILGFDYDTFSEFGGTPHFDKARRIVDLAQSAGAQGWTAIGSDQSRGSLITDLLSPRFRPLRQAYFTYHFNGLDHFTTRTDEARTSIMTALQTLKTIFEDGSRAYVFDQFFSTKYLELAAVFQESPLSGQAFTLLTQIDPAHLSHYTQTLQ